ncbi:MAG: D-arabinono-1,4-lactone oxidase [Bacteroidota bacterium]
MKNWAENLEWQPSSIAYPESEEAIQQWVERAANERKSVRVIGTGHSFTALCKTDEILMSLDKYQGLISVDKEKCQATVKAGTKLKLLGELLFLEGMAMENLGDIDVQSIAGTISTGTHGTGREFGTISTQVIALSFVNGKGELVTCSPQDKPELFKAAQVSMGLLGVITSITLQCVPSYKLLLNYRQEKMKDVRATLDERNRNNRNFEYYWIPYTDTAWTKTSNIAEEGEPDKVGFVHYWTEYVLENYVFKVFCELARAFPSQNKLVSKITAASISNVDKLYHSHKIYATVRLVKFTEMEYNIPADAYDEVWKELTKAVNSGKYNIHFPIENRWVKGDDIYMSPAFGRDSAYIACHVYNKKDNKAYFKDMEAIFRAHGGRPHWGKMNSLDGEDVMTLYPEFERFNAFRREHDPDGIFLSPYMKRLMGITKNSVAI